MQPTNQVTRPQEDGAAALFKQGQADLITMPSGEATILGLVADGYATDAQPWARTDLAIVGPSGDPAGIKGMTDAAAAVKKIIASKSALVVHGSLGADQVVRGIVQADKGPSDAQVRVLLDDHQKRVLGAAMEKRAYTLISRPAFRGGKLEHPRYDVMVEGDPLLRRPVVAAIANREKLASARTVEARRLMQFLCSAETQDWIRSYGKGKVDQGPLFFAVLEAGAGERRADTLLRVRGEVSHALALNADALAKLKRQTVRVKDRAGAEVAYEGVLVRDVLKLAGVPLGDHQMRGPNLSLYVTVEAADGYQSVFSLAEFDDDLAERSILLADRRDGKALAESEGPLRLVVPQEARPSRWVRRVSDLRVNRN